MTENRAAGTSMQDQVCLVTGANSGIGKVTARELAKRGATVVMICRSKERGEAARQEIIAQSGNETVELLLADLSSQQEIRRVAEEFKARHDRLDVLINNAGAIFYERQESVDGLEMTFALNHMAYFLLTNLLLDVIRQSAPARIINVSSDAHRAGEIDFSDLQNTQRYSGFGVYSETKLENILFTKELARRLEGTGVTVNAVHPGFVRTNFGRSNSGVLAFLYGLASNLFGKSAEKGAETLIYLATSPAVEGITGQYFSDKKVVQPAPQAQDMDAARRLWEASEKLVQQAAATRQ